MQSTETNEPSSQIKVDMLSKRGLSGLSIEVPGSPKHADNTDIKDTIPPKSAEFTLPTIKEEGSWGIVKSKKCTFSPKRSLNNSNHLRKSAHFGGGGLDLTSSVSSVDSSDSGKPDAIPFD